MLVECVVNISEGRDRDLIAAIAGAAGAAVADLHSDGDHNRSVVTLLSSDPEELASATRGLAASAFEHLRLEGHRGEHPRIGVVDVVPFVPLAGTELAEAVRLRNSFARWGGKEMGVPCFLYGPERDLPTVRREAFDSLHPDTGPSRPHPSAGAVAVGARPVLVAYNIWIASGDITIARAIASTLRSPGLRALGFRTAGATQVSFNLVEPQSLGPAEVYDRVDELAKLSGVRLLRAELVGLVPAAVLNAIPRSRWKELDLDEGRTIEARLAAR